MEFLVSIDPGLKRSGVAVFMYDWRTPGIAKLESAFVAHNEPDSFWKVKDKELMSRCRAAYMLNQLLTTINECREEGLTSVLVELPRINKGSPVDPEDIIQLATFVGSIRPDRHIRPHEWKRQIPKPKKGQTIEDYIVLKRVEKILSVEEIERIKDYKHHDVWDAIGMGLVYLERAAPGLTPL